MARKARGKYVEGQEPWNLLGIKSNAFYGRMKLDGKLGDEAREAMRRALEIAGGVENDEFKPVETPANAPVQLAVVKDNPVPEGPLVRPAAPAMVYQTGSTPVATVNVTLRSRVDQHDRLRAMAFATRRSIQDLVSTAVDEFLARHE